MATITVGGQKLWVDDAFNDLSPQAQADATAEIASRLQVAGPASAPFGFAPPPPPQGAGAPDSFAQRFQPALHQPLAIFNPPMPRPRPAEANGAAAPQTGAPDPQSAQSAGAPDSFALPPADPRLPWWATGPAATLQPLAHSQSGRRVIPADIDYVMAKVESQGNPTAKAKTSSATGVAQFVARTWLEQMKKHRPDLVQGRTDPEVLELRNDPDLSMEMTRHYREQNQAALRGMGLPVTPGTTYLAHFAGPTGARRVLSADPLTPASAVLTADRTAANHQFNDKTTAGDVIAWADRRMAEEAAARAAPFDQPSQTKRPVPKVTPFGWGLPNWLPPH